MRGAGFNPTDYFSQNAIEILQHIKVAEPQYVQAFALQEVGTHSVPLSSGFLIMLAAVEFDDQHQIGAIEIQHIGRAWMLSTKLETDQLAIT